MIGVLFVRFVVVVLVLVALVGCTSDSDGPDAVIPTPGLFDVLTATPQPTSSPAATPTATAVPTPTAVPLPTLVPLEAPPFPLHIDPDLASERPTDQEIVAGWTEFLTNVWWDFEALDGSIVTAHLCGDGSVYWNGRLDGRGQDWGVVLNPAMSSDDWGHVIVETKVGEFQSTSFLHLERSNGQVWGDQGPMEFVGSRQCIGLAGR